MVVITFILTHIQYRLRRNSAGGGEPLGNHRTNRRLEVWSGLNSIRESLGELIVMIHIALGFTSEVRKERIGQAKIEIGDRIVPRMIPLSHTPRL